MVNRFINTLVAFLIGGATLSFNFTAVDSAGTEQYVQRGTVICAGESYRMETDDALIVSDGKVKGIYQKGIDEIVLMSASKTSGDIMDNPFAILQNPGDTYTITATGADANGIPGKITLKSKTGALYTIDVKEYSKLPVPDSKLFAIDPDDYPTAVITDLR